MRDILGSSILNHVRLALTVSALFSLAACGSGNGGYDPALTYRYRMTVEVETPQGLRTGSSVIEVATAEGSGIPDRALHYRIRGEAVAVDLPGGTLFALLNGSSGPDSPALFAYTAFHSDPYDSQGLDWKQQIAWIKSQQETGILPRWLPPLNSGRNPPEPPRSGYPLLVRFRNIGDPKTIEAVSPDDLAKEFGPGTKLRRITIQVTNDAVTRGSLDELHWLKMHKGSFDPGDGQHRNVRDPEKNFTSNDLARGV